MHAALQVGCCPTDWKPPYRLNALSSSMVEIMLLIPLVALLLTHRLRSRTQTSVSSLMNSCVVLCFIFTEHHGIAA